MRSLILLYTIFFIVLSFSVYIEILSDSKEKDRLKNYSLQMNDTMEIVESSTMLLGGILATFVFPADVLFMLSIFCFFILITCLKFVFSYKTGLFLVCIYKSISLGLFKFLFSVILFDQTPLTFNMKLGIVIFIDSLCYSLIYGFVPQSTTTLVYYNFIAFPMGAVLILLILIGHRWKVYTIDSNVEDVFKLLKTLTRRQSLFNTDNTESVAKIISISKCIIIFFLVLPFGLCDSQGIYAYAYQLRKMEKPSFYYYAMENEYYFPVMINTTSITIFLTVLFFLNFLNSDRLRQLLSSTTLKIITGNSLMIFSTLYGGILESIVYSNATESECQKLSFYLIIPQFMLQGMSEILIIFACMEFLYLHSYGSIKYLSIALFIFAISRNGISCVISHKLIKNVIQDTVYTLHCRHYHFKLFCILYGFSGLALISLLISIFLMTKFSIYFRSAY